MFRYGLTKYREGLYPLRTYTKEEAGKVIDQVENWQRKLKKETGSNIVYVADEFYVKAERDIPEYERYENFPQLEDGIGLMAYFTKEFDDYLENLEIKKIDKTVSVATGKSAYNFIKEKTAKLEEKIKGLKINVYAIENTFFGPEITVTGLITGNDLIDQLKDKEIGEYLIIDEKMLKSDEDLFLDDVNLEKVEERLKIKIKKSCSSGESFIKTIIE